MMFAVITPALITGAFVERVRFKSFLVFSVLWATLVYDPVAHWVWGVGGILRNMGALDFAGGTVVHITAGYAALAFAMVIRPRKEFGKTIEPHNIPLTVLGAGLLWMGWFGFNGGSALAANGLAAAAVVNTNLAASAAGLVWMLLAWLDNKPSVLGIATGAVVGLVAITPGAGFVTPLSSIIIGALAAPISYYIVQFIHSKHILDESLDVFACHGIGGTWGALATGLFCTTSVNPAGFDGLFYGNPAQLGIQLVGVLVGAIYAFGVTFVLAKALDATIGLSVTNAEEQVGLDISEHGERAYA
jgi:Amt family ammonium transporter